jgi:hypothetical protein
MVTGASMANFVALAAARQWWGERHGVDVSERGLSGLPPMPVFSSGYVQRSVDHFPKQGERTPWRLHQNYVLDVMALRYGKLDDPELVFS